MRHLSLDIGCAAGWVHIHAARLFVTDGHDSAGAGSATLDEPKPQDPNIVDDDLLLDEEDIDNQPRGRREARQEKAYDELKSERDRLKLEREQHLQELAELKGRVSAIETGQETRAQVNARANDQLSKADLRAQEVVEEIKKLDKTDPNYATKVYSAMFRRLYTDLPEAAEEISRRTSTEVFRETRTEEQRIADAEREAVEALEAAGLSREHLRLVRFVARDKMDTEGQAWFRNTPKDEQVPKLVEEVVNMLRTTKRNSQDFKEDKRRHRESMEGVIGEGAGRGRGQVEEDETRREGPGSILADLTRMKQIQRKHTNIMLRQDQQR